MSAVTSAAASHAQTLRQAGLRLTPVRLGVMKVLGESHEPLAVLRLLERLPAHTDAVTVYRTLNTFTRKKLIHRIRGEDRTWRYSRIGQTAAPQHRHPHFVCEACGKVECLEGTELPGRFIEKLHIDNAYDITHAEVVLHGQCPRCRKG